MNTYDILFGALIGAALMYISQRCLYHSISRRRDKIEDKKLRDRLKEIEGELFDFEKK